MNHKENEYRFTLLITWLILFKETTWNQFVFRNSLTHLSLRDAISEKSNGTFWYQLCKLCNGGTNYSLDEKSIIEWIEMTTEAKVHFGFHFHPLFSSRWIYFKITYLIQWYTASQLLCGMKTNTLKKNRWGDTCNKMIICCFPFHYWMFIIQNWSYII